jgi:hypothetical protein
MFNGGSQSGSFNNFVKRVPDWQVECAAKLSTETTKAIQRLQACQRGENGEDELQGLVATLINTLHFDNIEFVDCHKKPFPGYRLKPDFVVMSKLYAKYNAIAGIVSMVELKTSAKETDGFKQVAERTVFMFKELDHCTEVGGFMVHTVITEIGLTRVRVDLNIDSFDYFKVSASPTYTWAEQADIAVACLMSLDTEPTTSYVPPRGPWTRPSTGEVFDTVVLLQAGSIRKPSVTLLRSKKTGTDVICKQYDGVTNGKHRFEVERDNICCIQMHGGSKFNLPNLYAEPTVGELFLLLVPAGFPAEIRSQAEFELAYKQLTAVLAFLHQNGIVHGDLSPRNIITIPGEPKSFTIIDFGEAEVAAHELETAGRLLTVPFAHPSLLRGDGSSANTTTDAFSLLASLLYLYARAVDKSDWTTADGLDALKKKQKGIVERVRLTANDFVKSKATEFLTCLETTPASEIVSEKTASDALVD